MREPLCDAAWVRPALGTARLAGGATAVEHTDPDLAMRRSMLSRAVRFFMLAALVAVAPAARSCGYHHPSNVSLGMLNWAYPDSLHVKTAVWMAQRDGVLAIAEPSTGPDAQSQTLLRQMAQLRETTANLGALQTGLVRSLDGREIPSFSVVLIGPMLWARFHSVDGSPAMAVHVDGPALEDVVLVSDAPVIASLVAGQLAPAEARRRGLLRAYGRPQEVERVEFAFDRMASLQTAGVPVAEHPR